MKILLSLLAFAAPAAFAGSWTSLEQLQGASRVNLKADLETQSREAGTSFTGARDESSMPAATRGSESESTPAKIDKPTLKAKDAKPEPPSPAETKLLKVQRAVGWGVAAAALGLCAVAVATGAAIPLMGLGLIFVGGLWGYLAHRRLQGKSNSILG